MPLGRFVSLSFVSVLLLHAQVPDSVLHVIGSSQSGVKFINRGTQPILAWATSFPAEPGMHPAGPVMWENHCIAPIAPGKTGQAGTAIVGVVTGDAIYGNTTTLPSLFAEFKAQNAVFHHWKDLAATLPTDNEAFAKQLLIALPAAKRVSGTTPDYNSLIADTLRQDVNIAMALGGSSGRSYILRAIDYFTSQSDICAARVQ